MEEIKELMAQILAKRTDLSQYSEILQEISEKLDRIAGGGETPETEPQQEGKTESDLREEIEEFNKYW